MMISLLSHVGAAHEYGIQVNPSKKCQSIIIGSANQISRVDWTNLPAIVFDGVIIPYRDNVKNLGVQMDRETFLGLINLKT